MMVVFEGFDAATPALAALASATVISCAGSSGGRYANGTNANASSPGDAQSSPAPTPRVRAGVLVTYSDGVEIGRQRY
jgi:hypothetical protein